MMENMNMENATEMVNNVVEMATPANGKGTNVVGIVGGVVGALATAVGGYFIGKGIKNKDENADKRRKKENAKLKKQGYIICKQVETEDGGIMMVPIEDDESK